MPKFLVINTSPLISLIVSLGDLSILRSLYDQVIVPRAVCDEINIKGPSFFGVKIFLETDWLKKIQSEVEISPF
jgi:predicted nucleic acid-binding protein